MNFICVYHWLSMSALSFANISVNSVPSVAKVFWLRLCRAVTSVAYSYEHKN